MTGAPLDFVREQIERNLSETRERIAAALDRSGRTDRSVTFIAVTKYAQPDWVRALVDLGHRDLGEARPQQLDERAAWFAESTEPPIRWHLIGHLQRNKVRTVLPLAHRIHSVDSVRLADRIDRLAGELNRLPQAFLEVNITGDPAKDGFSIDELREAWPQLASLDRVKFAGLMTMAPYTEVEDEVRSVFRRLRSLREELRDRSDGVLSLPELSMGMSGDYEIAIEEGSTSIRLGRSLWSGLNSEE